MLQQNLYNTTSKSNQTSSSLNLLTIPPLQTTPPPICATHCAIHNREGLGSLWSTHNRSKLRYTHEMQRKKVLTRLRATAPLPLDQDNEGLGRRSTAKNGKRRSPSLQAFSARRGRLSERGGEQRS